MYYDVKRVKPYLHITFSIASELHSCVIKSIWRNTVVKNCVEIVVAQMDWEDLHFSFVQRVPHGFFCQV